MALSKTYTINDIYSQVDNGAHNVQDFKLDQQVIVSVIKNTIMKHFGIANSALQKSYEKVDSGTVAAGVISIAGKNYFRVVGVGFGKSRPYIEAKSVEHFWSIQKSEATQTNTSGLYWYLMQGQDEIWIYQPSTLVASQSTLQIAYIRYPDLSWTKDDIQPTNSPYVDLPEWAVPHIVTASIGACLVIANLPVPQDMSAQVESAVSALSKDLAGNSVAMKQAGIDAIG